MANVKFLEFCICKNKKKMLLSQIIDTKIMRFCVIYPDSQYLISWYGNFGFFLILWFVIIK